MPEGISTAGSGGARDGQNYAHSGQMPLGLASYLRVGQLRALGLVEYAHAELRRDRRANHVEAILEEVLFADPRDRIYLGLPLDVVELGSFEELARRMALLTYALVEHHRGLHRRVHALSDRWKRRRGISEQNGLSAVELGARQLLADVIAGALRECRDRLFARQLENAWGRGRTCQVYL
jgi:hypothetical protein